MSLLAPPYQSRDLTSRNWKRGLSFRWERQNSRSRSSLQFSDGSDGKNFNLRETDEPEESDEQDDQKLSKKDDDEMDWDELDNEGKPNLV